MLENGGDLDQMTIKLSENSIILPIAEGRHFENEKKRKELLNYN